MEALQVRELVGTEQYVQLFREALRATSRDSDFNASLHGEQFASAVVTAHNYVLRRWLRGATSRGQAKAELELSFDDVRTRFKTTDSDRSVAATTVVVVTGTSDPNSIAEQVRNALTED